MEWYVPLITTAGVGAGIGLLWLVKSVLRVLGEEMIKTYLNMFGGH